MLKKFYKILAVALGMIIFVSVPACSSMTKKDVPTVGTASGTVGGAADGPFGKYSPEITINTVRALDSSVKFDTSNPDRKSLEENIWEKAYKEQLGIKFNYLWTPTAAQYNTKWSTAIASDDIPDTGAVNSTIYKMLVQGGLVEDCTNVFNKYASDLYKKAQSADLGDNGVAVKMMTFDGKLLGLPFSGMQPDDANLLFIRKDWLKKVNMTEPKTIDELIKVAKAFIDAKLGGTDTYGLSISKDINAGQSSLGGFLNAYGAYYNIWLKDSSGSISYSTIQPEMRTAILKLQEMYKAGLFAQDFAVKDNAKATEGIAAGKAGIMYGLYWAPLGNMKSSIKNDPASDWEVISIPTLDGSKPKLQATSVPSGYIFVKKGFKYPEAVVKTMNLNFKLIDEKSETYGTSDGIEVFKYRFACESFMPWKNLNNYIAINNLQKSGSTDTSKLNSEQQSVYKNIKAAIANDRSDDGTNIAMNIVFGSNSSYKVISDYKNDNRILVNLYQALPTDTMVSKSNTLKTDLDSAILKVIMGDDISTFDNAVSTWKNGGGATMTKEVNDWYSKSK